MDPVYTELCFWSIVHSLLNELEPSRYPLLSGLSVRESGSLPLTLTAEKTRRLLKQGLDKETAGRVRNLKGSTIEDHIVEIATHDPEFDFKPYISEQDQAEIAHAIREIDSRQLKKIKEHFGSKYSYFQIRLCMASVKE
nr:helix-turn-helix domain-containing protein [Metabacillus mangrovi]